MYQIDRFGRTPIYEQIIEQTERLIMTGLLKPGDQLPSVRTLSTTLSVNPNTLQKAYSELERRGLCVSVPGNGRFLTESAPRLVGERLNERVEQIAEICASLRTAGVPIERVIDAVNTAYGKGVNE